MDNPSIDGDDDRKKRARSFFTFKRPSLGHPKLGAARTRVGLDLGVSRRNRFLGNDLPRSSNSLRFNRKLVRKALGRFAAVEHAPPDELPDDEYPLMLTTGRVIYHWHGGEMTRRARSLAAMYPEALIEIHPHDAQDAEIGDGELMKVSSRRGEIVAKAEVTDRVEPGLIFATFHFPESSANFLTNPALDPTAKIPEYKVCAVRVEAD